MHQVWILIRVLGNMKRPHCPEVISIGQRETDASRKVAQKYFFDAQWTGGQRSSVTAIVGIYSISTTWTVELILMLCWCICVLTWFLSSFTVTADRPLKVALARSCQFGLRQHKCVFVFKLLMIECYTYLDFSRLACQAPMARFEMWAPRGHGIS